MGGGWERGNTGAGLIGRAGQIIAQIRRGLSVEKRNFSFQAFKSRVL